MPKHAPAVLKGKLTAFSDAATEGIYWSFLEDGKTGYDALHVLEKGDVLSIFNKRSSKKEIWKGRINLDYKKNRTRFFGGVVQRISGCTAHGIQKGIAPKQWAKMFFEEKPAQLILSKASRKRDSQLK